MTNKNDIERSIGRLEGKVDSLICDIQLIRTATLSNLKELRGDLEVLEEKFESVDKRQFTIITICSIVFTGILAFINKIF